MLESNEMPVIKMLGNRVKQLRIEKGYSQEALGYEAEIPKNQIGRIERGEINTTITTLYKISLALEVSLPEIVNF